MVEELLSYTLSDIEDLDKLMHVLSETSFCNEAILRDAINDENTHVFVIRVEGHIIGTATLCIMHTLEFKLAHVESVVVLPEYRGKCFGRELMTCIINEAKRMEVKFLQLTSNPKRISANNLYKMMGFTQYETNCYKLSIK
jgi:ribosomal-protein-alanine N-acetyltransferase